MRLARVLLVCLLVALAADAVQARHHKLKHSRVRSGTGFRARAGLQQTFNVEQREASSQWQLVVVAVTTSEEGDTTFSVANGDTMDAGRVRQYYPGIFQDSDSALDQELQAAQADSPLIVLVNLQDDAKTLLIFRGHKGSETDIHLLMENLHDKSPLDLEKENLLAYEADIQKLLIDNKELPYVETVSVVPVFDSKTSTITDYELEVQVNVKKSSEVTVSAQDVQTIREKILVELGSLDKSLLQFVQKNLVVSFIAKKPGDETQRADAFDKLVRRLHHKMVWDFVGTAASKPLEGGVSTGTIEDWETGTIGGLFVHPESQELYAVTNKHVYPSAVNTAICQPSLSWQRYNDDQCKQASTGASIKYPPTATVKDKCCLQMGTLVAADTLADSPQKRAAGEIDAAIARIDKTQRPYVSCSIRGIGKVAGVNVHGSSYPVSTVALGMPVRKYGARTHLTEGYVSTVNTDRNWDMLVRGTAMPSFADAEPVNFENNPFMSPNNERNWVINAIRPLVIQKLKDLNANIQYNSKQAAKVYDALAAANLITVFSDAGDSGSFVVDLENRVVGLLVGGTFVQDPSKGTVVVDGVTYGSMHDVTEMVSIGRVLDRINLLTNPGKTKDSVGYKQLQVCVEGVNHKVAAPLKDALTPAAGITNTPGGILLDGFGASKYLTDKSGGFLYSASLGGSSTPVFPTTTTPPAGGLITTDAGLAAGYILPTTTTTNTVVCEYVSAAQVGTTIGRCLPVGVCVFDADQYWSKARVPCKLLV